MDFSFTPDQTLLKNSARAFLDEHCKPATVRLLWDDPRGESPALWKEMAQLGWLGLSLPEAHGGCGGGTPREPRGGPGRARKRARGGGGWGPKGFPPRGAGGRGSSFS